MTYIRTIEIENFQSHRHTVLELSPGVNVIKGRSHSGKSAITRALEWALLNRLRGDYFTSWFKDKGDTTSVGVEYDDGSYIVRKKNGSFNGYELSTHKDPIEAIRTDLPEEVSNITQMGEINIQTQEDRYYMLSETAGNVAKELNKLVGLDIIDEKLTKITKLENENTAKIKVLEAEKDKAEKALKDLEFVADLEARTVDVEKLWESYEQILKNKRQLIDLSESIKEQDGVIVDNKEWLSIKKPAADLRSLIEKHEHENRLLLRLKMFSINLCECDEIIERSRKRLLIKEPVKALKSLIKEHTDLTEAFSKLQNIYSAISKNEIVRQRAGERVVQLKSKREHILKEHKKDFCDRCGAHKTHWRKI